MLANLFGWIAIVLATLAFAGRPNFVVLLADDVGMGDVEFAGVRSLSKTPVLNEMARGRHAATFTSMHSEAACTPTRVAILTGRAPIRDCTYGNSLYRNIPIIGAGAPSIASTLSEKHNYRTLFLGKWPLSPNRDDPQGWPSAMGFQNWTITVYGSTYDFSCFCPTLAPSPQPSIVVSPIESLSLLTRFPTPSNNYVFSQLPTSSRRLEVRDEVILTDPDWEAHEYEMTRSDARNSCFFGHNKKENYPCVSHSSPNYQPHRPPRGEMLSNHLARLFDQWIGGLSQHDNFFAQISFRIVHTPYVASPELRSRCRSGDICNVGSEPPSSRSLDYAGNIYAMDEAIGKIRESVRKRRPFDWDNTLIMFVSDNGPEHYKIGGAGSSNGLRGRKRTMFEGLLRVPALLEWPRILLHNTQIRTVTSILDIPVTILDSVGHQDSVLRDGHSMLPLLRARNEELSRPAPLVVCAHATRKDLSQHEICRDVAIIDANGTWKLIGHRADPSIFNGQASHVIPDYVFELDPNGYGEVANYVQTNLGKKLELEKFTNSWLENLFQDFRDLCPAYYPLTDG